MSNSNHPGANEIAAHVAVTAGIVRDAEIDDLQAYAAMLEDVILDVSFRLNGKGNPKWIRMHIEEAVYDIAARHNEAMNEKG